LLALSFSGAAPVKVRKARNLCFTIFSQATLQWGRTREGAEGCNSELQHVMCALRFSGAAPVKVRKARSPVRRIFSEVASVGPHP